MCSSTTPPAEPSPPPATASPSHLACQYPAWYPLFRSHALRSHIINLPPTFVDYLLSDGVFLGESSKALPKPGRSDEDSEDDAEDASDSSSSSSSSAHTQQDWTELFPELNREIAAAIEGLGGKVVPKLNWSCPTDAVWVNPGSSLICDNSEQVMLMLKSSDRVVHDLELLSSHMGHMNPSHGPPAPAHPAPAPPTATTPPSLAPALLDPSLPTLQSPPPPALPTQPPAEVLPAAPLAAHTPAQPLPQSPLAAPTLVLRKWYDLRPEREWRCFVRAGRLVGVCQRDATQHFPQLCSSEHALGREEQRQQQQEQAWLDQQRGQQRQQAQQEGQLEGQLQGQQQQQGEQGHGGGQGPEVMSQVPVGQGQGRVPSGQGQGGGGEGGQAGGDVAPEQGGGDVNPPHPLEAAAGPEARQACQLLRQFHARHVSSMFPLQHYTYDTYVATTNVIKLIDFNPVGDTTSPLLFTWEELGLAGQVAGGQAAGQAATAHGPHATGGVDTTHAAHGPRDQSHAIQQAPQAVAAPAGLGGRQQGEGLLLQAGGTREGEEVVRRQGEGLLLQARGAQEGEEGRRQGAGSEGVMLRVVPAAGAVQLGHRAVCGMPFDMLGLQDSVEGMMERMQRAG